MNRPGFRALLAAAVLWLPAAGAWADAPAGAFSATVTRDKAVFSFPVDSSQPFRWNRAADPAGALEYRFSVHMSDGGAKYEVGYFMVKGAASDPAEAGGLADLLKAGQVGVFREGEDGRYQVVQSAKVTADAKPGAVVLTVSGQNTVDDLLAGRPSSVTFESVTPGSPADSEDVLVTYAY